MKRKSTILILIALTFNSTIFAQTDRQLEREKPSAQTEKRIALVIGNGAYQKAKPLLNPANDAADMAQTLKDLGFEVLSGVNQNKRQMETLIREFGAKLASGGTGLFYYAGHGIQVGGENYIVPIDADIPDEDEVAYLAVPISLVLTKMTTAKNDLNIVILDACRNNPFARSWRSFRDSSNNDGLAKISPPTGTLVLYATEPGKVASDGAGRNGLFTEALLKQMKKPNLEYDQMVKALSTDVWQKSNKQQLPWKEGNSLQDFYFVKADAKISTTKTQPANETEPTPLPMPKPTPLPTPTPVSVAQNIDAEEIYWQEISNRDTRSGYELYLAEYQNGRYAVQANNKIKQFKQDELQKQKDIERSKWREAQNQNTRESYNSYLTAYPNGEFAADARLGVKALDSKAEQTKWLEANSINSKDAYKSYLALYPKGEFAASAGSKIREIENKEEQTKWDEVQFLNRKSAYQSYLSAYPNGKNAASAKQKIKEFDEEEARKLKEQEKAKEKAKWEEAERLKTVVEYKGYLSIYPNGEFASLARLRLRDLGEVVTIANRTAGAISKATLPGGVEMSFAYIPAGDFMMGSTNGSDDEKPVHKVTISQGFFMGRTEVTQAQWQAVMGNNPSDFKNCPNCPVEQVSWDDAQSFVSKLNAQNDGFKYRLPSEAEWEYAARAGTTGDYAGNLDAMAWYYENAGDQRLSGEGSADKLKSNNNRTHDVATKQPNAWGLYDMHGNVWEWCQDWYADSYYANSPSVNPTGATSGSVRVRRGGGWGGGAVYLRSALRFGVSPSLRGGSLGFRVVRY